MTREELLELMERFESGSIHRMEYSQGETRLVLEKAPPAPAAMPVPAAAPVAAAMPAPAAVPAAPAAAEAPAEAAGSVIKAPLVGTFYAAASPEAEAFVKAGDKVKKNDTVCIIEAMKMMSEVPAPCDCVIEEVLVSNGDLIGYDQPLFRVREL